MKSIVIMVYLSVLFLSITSGLVSGEAVESNNSPIYSTMEPLVSAPIVVENLSADCGGVITIPIDVSRTSVPAGDVVTAKEAPIRSVDHVSPGVVYGEARSVNIECNFTDSAGFDDASRSVSLVKTAENISLDFDPVAMTSHSLKPNITCIPGNVTLGNVTEENVTVLFDLLPETFEVKSVEPKSAWQEPMYEVIATKEVRILGLVPVSVDIEMEVDVSNGEIEITKKPWWVFLCSGGV